MTVIVYLYIFYEYYRNDNSRNTESFHNFFSLVRIEFRFGNNIEAKQES